MSIYIENSNIQGSKVETNVRQNDEKVKTEIKATENVKSSITRSFNGGYVQIGDNGKVIYQTNKYVQDSVDFQTLFLELQGCVGRLLDEDYEVYFDNPLTPHSADMPIVIIAKIKNCSV